MAQHDWYRSRSWDDSIAAEFEKRLSRSRTQYNRAQYVKIQGSILLDQPDAPTQEAGVRLLRRVIQNYPDEMTEVAHSHEILGDYFKRVGDFDASEAEYREVLKYYEETPSRTCTSGLADLSLVELILEFNEIDFYVEAENLLLDLTKRRRSHILFNADLFRYHAAFARLLARTSRPTDAAKHAECALRVGEIVNPQFPRHPTVGIPRVSQEMVAQLKRIASSLN